MTARQEQHSVPGSGHEPSFIQSLLPLLVLILMLAGSVMLFGEDSSYGPNQIALLFAAALAALIGLINKANWAFIQEGITKGIAVALGAILILLMVGALIGTWLLSGIVPTMIYYGLELLSPSVFYAASCVICAIVSVSIGSSWTTAATVGVALMGVAEGLGLSPAISAGAILSGAYFGDKMSPLSDTTNLAPAVAGSELFSHVRYMAWTSVPALVIALTIYVCLGLNVEVVADAGNVLRIQDQLRELFTIHPVMLIPLLVLLAMATFRLPALPSIFVGALLGALWAVWFQAEHLASLAESTHWSDRLRLIWLALSDGTQVETGDQGLDQLLSGGGMSSMLNTVWLILCAMTFGAVMERTGALAKLLSAVVGLVRSTGSLIATTILTGIGANIVTADQYMAIVLPGRLFRAEFGKRRLDPLVLSRSLEDGGTMTSALVPWNTCGVYMFGVLGVSSFAYAPYAFFLWLVPLIGISYGLLDFRILRLQPRPGEAKLDNKMDPESAQ